jgi:hypothetical protein
MTADHPTRSPNSPDPLWDDIYGEDGTARLLPGPPEVMSEADRRIASIAPRSSDSVRTPDLDVDRLRELVYGACRLNEMLNQDLRGRQDFIDLLTDNMARYAALHPASPPQEGTET